jgi:23S rRNA pseudouridine1911/1915/1917 synthase
MNGGGSLIRIELGAQSVGTRLDSALAAHASSLSRERVKALMLAGAVTDGNAVRLDNPSARLAAPMTAYIALPAPTTASAQPQDITLAVAYEDDHLIVVDKPAGLVVHPAAGNLDGTLVNALLHHCAGQLSGIGGVARPGIVHRIDKDTSGLIVAAKSDLAHEGLARQFAAHSVDRRYSAIVAGHPLPQNGTVVGNIGRSTRDRKKMALVNDAHGKHAVTHFRTIERLSGATLVECRLETGRTHQVRVHMAHIGHPLLGDPAYSRGKSVHRDTLNRLDFRRQALHAADLGFIHPVTGAQIALTSALPRDMQELLSRLRV